MISQVFQRIVIKRRDNIPMICSVLLDYDVSTNQLIIPIDSVIDYEDKSYTIKFMKKLPSGHLVYKEMPASVLGQ